MASNEEQIKELVRTKYGAKARGVIPLTVIQDTSGADRGCCGPADEERALRIYTEGELAGLPPAAVAASAGCGNPTALAGLRRGERVLDLGTGGGIDCLPAAQPVGQEG